MFDPDLFRKNLPLFALINPSLAQKFSLLAERIENNLSCLVPSNTEGELNIRFEKDGHAYYLHAAEGPKQEAHAWFQKLNLETCEVLYIYGLGLGYLYEAALPWLKANPNRYLVFLEDEEAIIEFWLGTPFAAEILNDIQVDIRSLFQFEQDRSIIRRLTQDNMLRPAAITALPSYQTHKASPFALLQDLIAFETAEQNIRYQEHARFGVDFFNNFYRNLLQLPHSYLAQGLFGQFKGIPAIICGAGPSLIKHIPLLKDLGQRALLFGPGSSLNVLSYHNVLPHFGVNIDPTEETFHRQIMNRAFETPIFYRNRIYYEALAAIHGPRLFISGSTYAISNWFESQLNIETIPIEAGYSVIHTALQIAVLLGCSPIIFVGMDLAFHPGQHYAQGIERHPLFPQQDTKPHLGAPIEVKNIKGEPIWSYWPWLAEAQWLDLYSRTHPDLTLLNATEEGIGLFSIPNVSLAEVNRTYLAKTYDLEKMIHESIQKAGQVPVNSEKIEESLSNFYSSLKTCGALCVAILQESHAALQKQPSSFPSHLIQQKEEELKKENGFNYLLEQFDDFFLTFIQKDLRNLARLPSETERAQQLAKLTEERYQFLIQAITINLKIIENALNENRNFRKNVGKAPIPAPLSQDAFTHEASQKQSYYYPTGAIYSHSSYQEGQREGKQLYYYVDGTLKTELHYKNGFLDGVVHLYYPNGQLKRELHFQQGQREGIEKSWYENGQLFTEVDYHQNIAKRARCWFSDGTLAKDIQI
ncbi:6-hydroxymethylpterin diphosphokinase MptE-like protein [Candidatus Protochlamydia phocaeensis]|uniref:6-hydroxymethylpterin diphosphokinase MptE-like protein n=1 Tax=Candidatus Protochlamydia phocaeensis TaxID=1414722 RepID=UPI0008395368|nr:6-hydroxymethylpterin diphosphokinase MptE-like protein [Candidatus Protochlamydia phocaeensis]